jgi:hypothetical protein
MLTLDRISRMTLKQQLILIGFIILPGALPILIFLLFVQRTIVKLTKGKTSKISGKINITEQDIYNDLNWTGVRDFVKKENLK